MSQAEALLNSLTETVIDHIHVVPDSDAHFTIDPYTREIINVNYNKTVLMRGDHNSERFTFELPRYVDGHDMSLCNRVIVHFDNVGDSIENIYSDVAYMDDLQINPNKPETVISSWLIRREATQIVGILSFSLQYQCVEEGEITYEWNTDSYDEIEIRKSKQNGEAAIIKYTNVLEQWRSQIFGAGDSVITNITTEGANQVAAVQTESATQQAAIELKGSETLASIPEDYTEVYNMAEEALRTKADGVVCEAEGETIVLADASDDYIRGLNLYGKSTQVATTGKNLFTVSEPLKNAIMSYDETSQRFTVSTGTFGVVQQLRYFDESIPAGTDVSVTVWFDSGYLESGSSLAFGGYHDNGSESSWQCEVRIPNEVDLTGKRYTASVTTSNDTTSFVFFANTGSTITENLVCKVQYELNSEATEYESYTGGIPSPNPQYPQDIVSIESPIINVCGKNLYSMGDLTLNGNSRADTIFQGPVKLPVTLSWTQDFSRASGSALFGYVVDGAWYYTAGNETPGRHITPITNGDTLEKIMILNWATETGMLTNIQIEIGEIASDYEPHKTAQSLAITSTLPGIPVYSGGNYTDPDSQQWICDEVDLERGVYIQRIGTRVFDETGNYHINSYRFDNGGYYVFGCSSAYVSISDMPVMSDKLAYKQWSKWEMETENNLVCYTGYSFYFYLADQTIQTADAFKSYVTENPITVNYILATPIETPLTAEEIETYKSIKTNYPNTTVLNDSGAWMKVKYNADTKLYVNNTVETGVVKVVEGVLNDTY